MAVTLPEPLRVYMNSEASRDHNLLAECFAPDAVVEDEDRKYEGLAAIREWKRTTHARYQYTVTPLNVVHGQGEIRLLASLAGEPYQAAQRNSCTLRDSPAKNRVVENPAARRTGVPPRAGDRRNQGHRSRSRQSAAARRRASPRGRAFEAGGFSGGSFRGGRYRERGRRCAGGRCRAQAARRHRHHRPRGGGIGRAGRRFLGVAGLPLAAGAGAEPARGGED